MSGPDARRDWLAARAPDWRRLAEAAARARARRGLGLAAAQELLEGYRRLARDLAVARRELPGSGITSALEGSYASFHALVNRPPRSSRAALLRYLREDVPAAAASLRGPILWVLFLFVLSAGAGWWLIQAYPDVIGLVASPEMIAKVEHGELWTDGILNVTPSSVLSVEILSNNIAVTVFAVCVGVFYGLGTFYLIALNGFMIGGVFAFTYQHDLAGALFRFIVAHGTVELSVIFIAGGAGMALGDALARPRSLTRLESFQRRVAELGKLVPVLAVLLVGCGLIEGYVSPDPDFPLASRLVIGAGYFFVMVSALNGRLYGRGRGADQTRRSRLKRA